MYLANVTWPKAEQYFKDSDMVIIPIGSIECHGRHMPLGTDAMIPDKILQLVEQQTDRIMIIPTLSYGACESLWPFPGTINLGSELLYQLVKQVVMNLRRHGAKKFLVLNGHGGNIKALERVGYELDQEGCMMALLNWWLNVWEMNPEWKGGHGGGDPLLLNHLFRGVKDDPFGLAAGYVDGAKSILTGIGANIAMKTGLPVKVQELIHW